MAKSKNNMLYDITIVPLNKEVVEYFPEIEMYDEFQLKSFRDLKYMTRDLAFRFVALIIDPESPLFKLREISQRCENAIEMLKLELSKEETKSLISLKAPEIRKAILRYFIMLNSYEYEQWFSQKMLFHEITALMQKPVEGKDAVADLEKRMKFSTQLAIMSKEIMKKEAILFDDERLRQMIANTATASKKINWAEILAEDDGENSVAITEEEEEE